MKARLTGFSFHAKPQRYRERWSPTTGRLETRHRRAPALNESQETQPIVGSRPHRVQGDSPAVMPWIRGHLARRQREAQ